ncbi:stage III sporulation protein AG [Kroppenstedtia guangzhouensis]|uniref:Stage III sporulation protein AG n=1 Tax=Kroppenstedtia guangzhouensis TaxID=1274356 RepID=A0ABQ1GA60_9BACL|nr:stage III sporulation protein AG [Kroppenstedtia guangzhouensis]GGA39746.1 stage III sporulation protein AG [Kroppenstedtia guangzhouensis]
MLKQLLDRVEKSLGDGGDGSKRVNAFRWLIIVGCFGVALMILSSFFSVHEEVGLPETQNQVKKEESAVWNKKDENMTIKDYESLYEARLTEVLSKIVGVDDVEVMVNLDSSEETVVEKDIRRSNQVTDEQDQKGGTRKSNQENSDEKVVLQRKGDGEQPIVLKKLKPQVRGVLVVAKGAENLKVKAAMIEAIQRVLDVPMHRISVMPKG